VKKFEYLVESRKDQPTPQELQAMCTKWGEAGWELRQILPLGRYTSFVLVREKKEQTETPVTIGVIKK
jgi:hypothetical protein